MNDSNSSELNLTAEIRSLEKKVNQANLPDEVRVRLAGMIDRLKKMSFGGNYSQEFEPVAEYINWVIKIPFGKYTEDILDIKNAKEALEKYHYGLQPVKTRILEYLAIIKLQNMNAANKAAEVSEEVGEEGKKVNKAQQLRGNSANAPIMCFVGIQGVGKTSIAKSISLALGREFNRVALGGLGNVTEIRGITRGQVNAEPGQIVKALIRTNSMNPLILLDEIDKVSADTGLRADVMAALLEILDPEQNSTFMDKYLDFPLDLSQCIFITTANNLGGISAALLDRLEVIRFGSYNDEEKKVIAKSYLLPKVRKSTGLTEEQLGFDDDVWDLVIRPLGFDAGVRQLERTLTELARKIAFMIVNGTTTGVRITKDNFRDFIPEQIGIFS